MKKHKQKSIFIIVVLGVLVILGGLYLLIGKNYFEEQARNRFFQEAYDKENENYKNKFINKSTSIPFSELGDYNNWGLDVTALRSSKYTNIDSFIKNKLEIELNFVEEKKYWFDNVNIKKISTGIAIELSGYIGKNLNSDTTTDYNRSFEEYSSIGGNGSMLLRSTNNSAVNRVDCRVREIEGKKTIEMIARITDKERTPEKQDNTKVPYSKSCELKDLAPGRYYVDYFGRSWLTGKDKIKRWKEFDIRYKDVVVKDEDYYFAIIDVK